MTHSRLQSDGFHLIAVALTTVVLGVIVVAGVAVINKPEPKSINQTHTSTQDPVWQFNENRHTWEVVGGQAPACPSPLTLSKTPVDIEKVRAISLPGAYRGYNYKAHGGFRLADTTNGYAQIVMPMNAKLMNITRYYEQFPGQDPELQYLLDFENDCGIAFRFDHLQTLSPAFQAYAEKAPAPKLNDTRGNPNQQAIRQPFKTGDVIATRVGFPSTRNYGFDFGVYDYRQRNKISTNKAWAAIHQQSSSQHFYGICWIPLLPATDASKAEAIAKDRNNYNSSKPFNLTSDYCDFAPHKTLEFNGGQPTDG